MHTILKLLGMAAAFVVALPALCADEITSYLDAVADTLDPRAAETIDRLDGTGRQLLAARSYLRNANLIAERWSWSQQQIDAYQDSPAQKQLDAEIDRVRLQFELQNAGFSLLVNPQVRSLEIQIEQWNSNASVAAAADELQRAATTFVASGEIAGASITVGCESFANFLLAYVPRPAPTIAAPGLTRHGQMQAVDFLVISGGVIVAGPDTQSIESEWLQAGWRDKLSAAVIASGAQFEGPLEKPDEPWHYTYRGPLEPSTASSSTIEGSIKGSIKESHTVD